MPLQNRVTPEGDIIATPARGTYLGNRGGCFHHADKTLTKRRWRSNAWITCTLEFKNRRRALMQPGRYTELFFLDEATALAAGHRPCFECRYEEAFTFAAHWANAVLPSRAEATTQTGSGDKWRAKVATMDKVLHEQRLFADGSKRTHRAALATLPDGAFIKWRGSPHLVVGNKVLPWSPAGYSRAVALTPGTDVETLTPRAIIAVIKDGYTPKLHYSVANAS